MPRVIEYFEKEGDAYIDEVVLPGILLEELQKLFNVEEDDPMYDCFPIGEKEAIFFKSYIDLEFCFDDYDYFLGCYGLHPR